MPRSSRSRASDRKNGNTAGKTDRFLQCQERLRRASKHPTTTGIFRGLQYTPQPFCVVLSTETHPRTRRCLCNMRADSLAYIGAVSQQYRGRNGRKCHMTVRHRTPFVGYPCRRFCAQVTGTISSGKQTANPRRSPWGLPVALDCNPVVNNPGPVTAMRARSRYGIRPVVYKGRGARNPSLQRRISAARTEGRVFSGVGQLRSSFSPFRWF